MHSLFRSRGEARLSTREALLRRQVEGVETLIARAGHGPLVPLSGERAVAIVDKALVRSLLRALTPSEHFIAGRYRVQVRDVAVEFEDGLALIRLDGRASLAGAESRVFADLSVFGDLEVLPAQPRSEVLEARIKVVAVEARRVDVVVEARAAEELVEDLGKTTLDEFAVLASPLQIPVRQQHTFHVPAVGPQGPVRIEPARVSLQLNVIEVTALHGKLFISMAAGSTGRAPERSRAVPPRRDVPAATAAGPAARLVALERAHRHGHERLEELVADDPFLREAIQVQGDVALAVRADFALDMVRELARTYLDRVDLSFKDLDVVRRGALMKDTFLGRIHAGDWTVGLTVHEIDGVLRAGEPEVAFLGGNRVDVAVPVQLQQGKGRARIHFDWDSRGIANLVCRDFEATQEVEGIVTPEAYPVRGTFALAVSEGALIATPAFRREFRIKFDLEPSSWDAVRARLEEQDRFSKCGMAMDPERVLARLRELTANGFNVRVPARVFRSIELESRVADTLRVAQRDVTVAMTRSAVRTSPDLLWYSASVAVRPASSWQDRAIPAAPAQAKAPAAALHSMHPAKACAARPRVRRK